MRPRAQSERALAPATLLLEQTDTLLEGRERLRRWVARRGERLGEHDQRTTALGRVGLTEQRERLPSTCLRLVRPLRRQRLLGLLRAQIGEVLWLGPVPEEPLGGREMRPRFGRAARGVQRPRAGKVGAREMEAVVAGAQQGGRAPEVVECDGRLVLECCKAPEGAVKAHTVEWIAAFLDAVAQLRKDVLSAVELAEIAQGEAQIGSEAELVDAVLGGARANLVEAVGEELGRFVGAPHYGVGAAERQVDIRPLERCEPAGPDRTLDQLRRGCRVAALARCKAERDAGAGRCLPVTARLCFGEQVPQLSLDVVAASEAQRELGIGEAQLALLLIAEIRAGFQVLDRHTELRRELP